MAEEVVLSTRQWREVDSGLPPNRRRYYVAPLSHLQRGSWREEVARRGLRNVTGAELFQGQIQALEELAPANMAECRALLDDVRERQEAAFGRINAGSVTLQEQADLIAALVEATRRMGPLEAALREVPVYANLLAQNERFMGAGMFLLARYALRGWHGINAAGEKTPMRDDEGFDLPEFEVGPTGIVTEALLDQMPREDIDLIAGRAQQLLSPTSAARGNSVAPSLSPSPETGTSRAQRRQSARKSRQAKTSERSSSAARTGKGTR